MRSATILLAPLSLVLFSCGGGGGSTPAAREFEQQTLVMEWAFPALSFVQPVALLQAPDDDSRWFIVQKGGQVLTFVNDDATMTAALFIDISDRVEAAPSEAGLLGMAFHPLFALNGEVFLSYTAAGSGTGVPLISHISRFTSHDGGKQLDPDSEEVLLAVEQPFTNHNGGHVAFGPDGFLYIGLGDGGSGGDPLGNGQNIDTLLGAILRIDVESDAPYGIPPDNPFSLGGGRSEIFAWGLRNPWRWSFDRVTGELWAGDVGQSQREEVDRIVLGGNYGWNIFEGTLCFGGGVCDPADLIPPLAEYSHSDGCSITGGIVYRGTAITSLAGTYLYGDFCSGTIWGLDSLTDGTLVPQVLLESRLSISAFAEGNDGEPFVVDYTSGTLHRFLLK